ncbi:glucan endo-1,3-beta-glucosidase, partial [Aureococcus anophagefferens]
MTRRVARAALACAAVGARAQFCEVTIQVDGAGVGLAFADDAELDAAVRGFVARFALPLDQMGCADDGCAVEYIKAHARLNAACDAAPYGDAAASDVDAASPDDAAPLDDDNAARSEPGAAADAGEREASAEAAPAGAAALLPSTLEDYVTLWMVAWSACFAVAAVVAALDRALDLRVEDRCPRFRRAFSLPRGARRWLLATGGFAALLDARGNLLPNLHDALHGPGGLCRVGAVGHASLHDLKVEGASYALYALEAALGAAQLFAASMDAPASPLRETLLWVLLHSSERACSESHGLGKQWAYAALVQLWVALTPDDPGPSAGAVGVLFQIWATHAFSGAEKAGLGRE